MKVGGVGRDNLASYYAAGADASVSLASKINSNTVLAYAQLTQDKSDTTNYNLKDKGEKTMTQRKTVKVELFDDSVGISAAESLVYTARLVSDLSNQQIIYEVLMRGEVADNLEGHNEFRSEMVNEDILQRTGREVMLRPVRLKDLRWVINGVNV